MFHPQRFHLFGADSSFNATQTKICSEALKYSLFHTSVIVRLDVEHSAHKTFKEFLVENKLHNQCFIDGIIETEWLKRLYVCSSQLYFIQINTVSVFILFFQKMYVFRILIWPLREWFNVQSAFCVPHEHMSVNFNS